MPNKLVVASAGAGKTTFIVDDALERAREGERVLITTFTEACEQEIKRKILVKNGCVPELIIIKTWFSCLIQHGVKPFQGALFDFDVKGMILVSGQSGFRYMSRRGPVYYGEADFERYFFDASKRVYSDKLSKLVIRCNGASKGKVFERLARCFDAVYIDEIQDMAGYDLDVIEGLMGHCNYVVAVGDPRQATYVTHNSKKNAKYKGNNVAQFFIDSKVEVDIDEVSLTTNHRCRSDVCVLSNQLYPDFPQTLANAANAQKGRGLYLIPESKAASFLSMVNPVQLRDSSKVNVNEAYPFMNFGKSKGLTLEHVLIYPSGPMATWLIDVKAAITEAARAKLYVALTRSKAHVGIILKDKDVPKIGGIYVFDPKTFLTEGDVKAPSEGGWAFSVRVHRDGFQGVAIRSDQATKTTIYGYAHEKEVEAVRLTKKIVEE